MSMAMEIFHRVNVEDIVAKLNFLIFYKILPAVSLYRTDDE